MMRGAADGSSAVDGGHDMDERRDRAQLAGIGVARTRRPRLGRLLGPAVGLVAAIVLAGCTTGTGPVPTPSSTGDAANTALAADIADVLQATIDETGVPGIAVSYIGPDGTVTVQSGVATLGDDASDDFSGDTFAYRSITKSFIVTMILQLADAGALTLDDPIEQYVPGIPRGTEITLRQLAGMRSGLPNYSASEAFQTAFAAGPTREWTDAELLATVTSLPLDFEPGSRFEYSNTNTVLLGLVVEALDGRPWADSVRERITSPLELTSVAYPVGPAMADPAATGYQLGEPDGESAPDAEALPAIPFSGFSAAGGLAGTVDDLARWAEALGGGVLLNGPTQAERIATPSDLTQDVNAPFYDAYGLGMGEIEGWWGHTGNGLGFQALAMHDIDTGRSIAIVLNATSIDPDLPAHIFQKLLPLLG